MIPQKTVEELIAKHSLLEKDLSSGDIDKKLFAEKSKEYSDLNEIIDVLLRILSVLVLFISCGLLVYFSHEKLKVSLINQQDPIVTVPLDAGIVVESNKLKATLLNMSETNLIWSKLLEYQAFKEFDQLIEELDVFINKEQTIYESLNNKKIIVSFHPSNNGSEIFVALKTPQSKF